MKIKKCKESLTTTIKSLLFFFVYAKGYILLKNTVWENVVYTTITFLLKSSLVFQDIWNELMKHRRLYICIGPVGDLLWPKTFGNRLGIFTSVLIAMEYFVRRQKSTFNLENKKCICQGNFFVSHVIRSTCSGLI